MSEQEQIWLEDILNDDYVMSICENDFKKMVEEDIRNDRNQ